MKVVYLANKAAGPVTQNRLGEALEHANLKTIKVIWCPTDHKALREELKDVDLLVITVQTTKLKAINKMVMSLPLKRVVYMEDINNPLVWHACRYGAGYIGSSLFPWEPDVRTSIQSLSSRVRSKPFWFLGHFGYEGLYVDPTSKQSKIVFPSTFFTASYSSRRVEQRNRILAHPYLKDKVDFLDASKGIKDLAFVKHLGTYKAVLVVVPGTTPLDSFVVRKVYETLSTASALLMDFGVKDSYAKRAMDRLGFVEGVHYLDVTENLMSFSFDSISHEESKPEDLHLYSKTIDLASLGQVGYEFVQKAHLGNHRVDEFQKILEDLV